MDEIFSSMKKAIGSMDPVAFCEDNLTLDGSEFRVHGNGYKPFADIYRYIGLKALEGNSKPIVLVKGRQVGATTMAGALELFFMSSGLFGVGGRPPMRIIHAFPTLIHVFTYAKTKFNPMIKTAKPYTGESKKKISVIEAKIDKSSDSSDSLQYKQFVGGNFLRIESTGLDADRLRGGTVDAIFYDECQDIPRLAIANANKLLTTAKYGRQGKGIQVYFGTPKQRGSDYNKIWEKSNKQYYHLGCEHCGEYFPLYTPGSDAWEDIWVEGKIVKCTHCNTLQDKIEAAERGKWIPTVTNEDEYDYIGFHINQLYNPAFDKKTIIDDKPINNPLMGDRTWNNEVLGEFYSGEGGPITFEEIEQNCKDERKMREGISIKENKLVFAGFDWGKRNDPESMSKEAADASGGQSFSTAVVLSLDGPHRLSIDFATIIKKNDFEYKKNIIHEIMRKYSVTQAVGDIGYAQDLTDVMQREYNDRFLASNLVSKVNGYIRLNDTQFPKVILAEREYHIQEMFNIMKKGLIRFPFNDWERIAWLIKHCTSMEVKTTFNAVNEPVRRFVKGSDPNDGFMALLNAYLAYKYYISGGFKDQKAGITSTPKDKRPLALVGSFPLYN